jgi:hypothetical protein
MPYVCMGCDKSYRRTYARKRHWDMEPECAGRHILAESLDQQYNMRWQNSPVASTDVLAQTVSRQRIQSRYQSNHINVEPPKKSPSMEKPVSPLALSQ